MQKIFRIIKNGGITFLNIKNKYFLTRKQTDMNKIKKEDIIKKIKLPATLYSAVIVAVAGIFLAAALIYVFEANNRLTKFSEKFIPYPAAVINYKNFVTLNTLNSNLLSVKQFYENQDFSEVGLRVDFTTDDGKKRLKLREKELLNKMIEDKAIEILAKRNGITITAQSIDQNVERKLEEFGTKDDVENRLSKLYGWTLDDFKQKAVKPGMYQEELEKIILEQNKDKFSGAAREKIEKAARELNGKKDFSEVAKAYSDGSTAQDGGELGWFKKDQLVPEISSVAFSFDKGRRSDMIESELGFHIVEVEDKKTEGKEELVKIRQIFARKETFADWLDEQIKQMKIFIPLKEYNWNREKGMVEFSDEKMKEFEKSIMENFQGDASVIF